MNRFTRILMSAAFACTVAGVSASVCFAGSAVSQVDIHDPAMGKDGNTYYLYSTGPGITFYSSKDRVKWVPRGRVFEGHPAWAKSVVKDFGGHIWAPDVIRHDGKFYMYYSVSGFGKNDSAIGVTVSKTLDPSSADYKWEDQGIVLRSVAGRDMWNAIDPNIITDDAGTAWMTFGSFWSGIKLVKLDSSWTKLAEPEEWHSLAARPRNPGADEKSAGDGAIEGPFLFRKNGYYYLFVSTGFCCKGKASTYRIAYGRAKNVTGPYLDKDGRDMAQGGGTPLLPENKNWAGWGGQGVYDFDGTDYVVMHAYENADNDFHRLKVLKITWGADGWASVDGKAIDAFHGLQVK